MSATLAEPIPVRITRFKCPSCPRTHSSKVRARKHMADCWADPNNKGCKTCVHFRPNPCCGAPDLYGCYTPTCPTEQCAAGLDPASEATGPGALAIHCPSWAAKGDGDDA